MSAVRSSAALRLLHYWWPLLMGVSLTVVIHRATGRTVNYTGEMLLLCGIAAVYSLDRVVDVRPLQDTRGLSAILLTVGALASFACLVFMTQLPPQTTLLALVMAILAVFYPTLKKVPLTKTILVAIAWTWSVIAFPFADGSWAGWRWTQVPVALPVALLVAAGCLLCDLKDRDEDHAADVASLPVLIGSHSTTRMAMLLAGIGVAVALAQHRPGLAIGGACLAIAALRPALLSTAVVGPLIVDAILTLPGALIAARLV